MKRRFRVGFFFQCIGCRPQNRIAHEKLHALVFRRIRVRHHVEPDELLRELLLPVLRAGTQAHGASRQSRNRRRYVSFFHKNTA
ncbi:MAG: hypothetical protein V8T00_07960 [Oscillospiraceae bacterium]